MAGARSSIREHFLDPRGRGRLERPDGVGRASNAACGDRLELSLAVEGEGQERVRELRYEAVGCAAVTATASLVAWHMAGRSLVEAGELDVARLVEAAGGLPPNKGHAPRLVQRALREALAHHRSRCHP